jgi:hypothetical protein
MSPRPGFVWRVTRNKVQGSSFYGADQIGLHLRKEAQSEPTKCLIVQWALGKFPSMNCTSIYTPSSKLYRILADPIETMELKNIADLLKHCLTVPVKMDSLMVPGIT